MEHYSVNVGHIDVMFMCGNGKGFNVARGLKQFIAAARAIDNDVCILPLRGQYNNLCIPAAKDSNQVFDFTIETSIMIIPPLLEPRKIPHQ
jgi:hypothetical protein